MSDRGVTRPSHFSISYKNYIILYRINLLDQEIQWYVVAPLFNDLPQNINYKKTVESKELNGDILTVNYKAVAESGEVWRDTIKVNINTGELVN